MKNPGSLPVAAPHRRAAPYPQTMDVPLHRTVKVVRAVRLDTSGAAGPDPGTPAPRPPPRGAQTLLPALCWQRGSLPRPTRLAWRRRSSAAAQHPSHVLPLPRTAGGVTCPHSGSPPAGASAVASETRFGRRPATCGAVGARAGCPLFPGLFTPVLAGRSVGGPLGGGRAGVRCAARSEVICLSSWHLEHRYLIKIPSLWRKIRPCCGQAHESLV